MQLLGTSTMNGLHVGHTEIEVATILKVIQEFQIKKFVEVGVHVGGLANILSKLPGLQYMGIENNPSVINEKLTKSEIFFVYGDCFSPETIQKVMLFMHCVSGASLVYCDNGNKPKELLAYYNILEPGDYIFAHDYYDTMRVLDDLPGFGVDLDFPKPEVLESDIEFLRTNKDFVEVPTILDKTRICGFMRI